MKPSLYQSLPKSRRLSPKLTVFIALWLFIPPLLFAQTTSLTETFSTQTLPAGWQVLPAEAGNNGWVFNNPNQRGADWTPPPSNFALADGKVPDRRLVPIAENFERVADLQVTLINPAAAQFDATGGFMGLATTTPPVPAVITTLPIVTPLLTTTTGELILTEEDNGKTVELHKGNTLKVIFTTNSFGSYGRMHPWQSWQKISGDEAIVKQIGGITGDHSDPTKPWSKEIYTFEAIGIGQTVLEFTGGFTGLDPIGEPLSLMTFSVTVVVKSAMTSPSPVVVAPPVAAISLVTTCPTSGTISNFCNADGKTLTDVKIEAPANVSKATLSGQIDNQGWVSNSTIAKDATLTGGTLTGSIKNQGTISDIKFVGMLLEGGTLAGTITNASRVGGTMKNVHFAANAKLSGGKLAGEIQGDCGAPAQLDHLTVVAGSKLTCVTIGTKVVLGKGVTVESPTTTTPTTPPVETNDLPSLGEGVATDAKGKTVTTTAKFAGGVSLNDSKTFAQAPTAKVLADSLNIQGQITVDAKDVKQTANLVVFLTYQATAEEKPVPLMFDSNGGLQPWDEKPASLVPFRKEVVLEATQTVDIYKGVLLTTGLLKITFGYQLKDGTLVQSPNTIDLTVATETASETTTQVLTETDNGKTIELPKGQTLKVTLVSNPTTGYSWEKTAGDETILQQLGEANFVSDPHPEGMTGVGGQETFTLEATGTGKTTLTLIYHRPFETDTLPIRTFEVKVVVK